MAKYTVVLLYPEHMTDRGTPQTYLGLVDATQPSAAGRIAQVQALRVQSYKGGLTADDFLILHIFEGYLTDVRWNYFINTGD